MPRYDTWKILTDHGTDLSRVLLYGPPGTGKTYLAQTAGVPEGMPVYRVICTEDTPMAELRGHYIPKGNQFEWHNGPVMMAYRYGGRLVVDEINRATDDALSFMLAVLDGLPVTLPDGTTITPHPGLSVWATTNATPSVLSDALADRFTVRVKCDTVNPAALATLPADIRTVVSPNPASGVSMRQGKEFAALRTKTMGPDIAAYLIWESRSEDVQYTIKLAETARGRGRT